MLRMYSAWAEAEALANTSKVILLKLECVKENKCDLVPRTRQSGDLDHVRLRSTQ